MPNRHKVRTLNERIDGVLIDVTEIQEKIELTVVQDSRDAAEKANLLRDAL